MFKEEPKKDILNVSLLIKDYKKALPQYIYTRTNENLNLLLKNIDHFKQVNDTYGHLAGDRVLRDIATFLKNNTRHNVNPITGKPDRTIDGIYRFGGEKILLLLKNIKNNFQHRCCKSSKEC